MTASGEFIPEPVMTCILTHATTRRVGGRERERERKKRAQWPNVEEGREMESDGERERDQRGERGMERNVGRPALIFLGSQTKDTAGRVGGCQSGKGASSICHLSFSLSSCYLFPAISLFPRLCPAVSSSSWEGSEGK